MIELINEDIVKAMLLSMPGKIRLAVERKAVAEVTRIAAERLKQNAPRATGLLAKSIGTKTKSYGGQRILGIAGVKVTADSGKKRAPSRVVHLLELGTKQRQTQSGANRGSIAGRHFIEQTAREIESMIRAKFESEVKAAFNG